MTTLDTMAEGHPLQPDRSQPPTAPLDSPSSSGRARTVRAACRRAHSRRRAGDPAAALRAVEETIAELGHGGDLPPEIFADLYLWLLQERRCCLQHLAENYGGPRRRLRRVPSLGLGALAGLALFTLAAAAATALAVWAAAHAGVPLNAVAPWVTALGAVATVLAAAAVLAPPRHGPGRGR
jgi:hypothetical protein